MKPKIITHGGATTKSKFDKEKQKAVKSSAEFGHELLTKGAGAIDVVEKAVILMEDSPFLNAGTGSYLQMDGKVRMDACIIGGEPMNVGAVIDIRNVKNPISVARDVMEKTEHVILAGHSAHAFAHGMGFEDYDPITDEKTKIWNDLKENIGELEPFECLKKIDDMIEAKDAFGTVGCVAIDENGILAAATSTGGLRIDLPGRVGDTPIIGSGTYANSHAAVSCTGIGESIIKAVLAHRVVHHIEVGKSAKDAAKEGIETLGLQANGKGGLICIDKKGECATSFNTEKMFHHIME